MVASRPNRPLTPKEEAFCRLVANGENFADAYRKAWDTKAKSAKVSGCLLARRPEIVARIKALQVPDEQRLFLTRARKRELLLEIAEGRKLRGGIVAAMTDRLRAIDIDNRMTNDYEQTIKVEGEITLSSVVKAIGETSTLPSSDEVIDLETVKPLSLVHSPPSPDDMTTATTPERSGQPVDPMTSNGETTVKPPVGVVATPPASPFEDEEVQVPAPAKKPSAPRKVYE